MKKISFINVTTLSLVTIILSSCAAAGPSAEQRKLQFANTPKRELTSQEKTTIEHVVKEQLKDPDLARFEWNKYIETGSGIYCGYVNAKNSFGGYTGNVPYQVMLSSDDKSYAGLLGIGIANDHYGQNYGLIETCADHGY